MNQWLSGGRQGVPVPIETAQETERSRPIRQGRIDARGESGVSFDSAEGGMPLDRSCLWVAWSVALAHQTGWAIRRAGTGNLDLRGVTAGTCW